MANIASNRVMIRGKKENVGSAIQVLNKTSYCGDVSVFYKSDDCTEYDMEFFSRWGEPMEALLELSEKYDLEFDGYTKEHGGGYYSEWAINCGEKINRHYCKIDREHYKYEENEDGDWVCPFCGEEDTFSPNCFETGIDSIYDVWICDSCGEEAATHHELHRIEGSEEFMVTIAD